MGKTAKERLAALVASAKKAKAASPPPTKPIGLSMVEKVKAEGNPLANADVRRITKQPIQKPVTDEEVDKISKAVLLRKAYNAGKRLLHTQAWAIREVMAHVMLFAPIGVGWGKTLITIWLANYLYKHGQRRIVLLVPAAVYEQTMGRQLRFIRGLISVGVPIHGLGRKSKAVRMRYAKSRRPGLYVVPYSLLSQPDAEDFLDAISPDHIIADEAHKLANRRSARTRRWRKFMARNPRCGFSPLSGTITDKALLEYHHLVKLALDRKSFLPESIQMCAEWSSLIDAGASSVVTEKALKPYKGLLVWCDEHFPEAMTHGGNSLSDLRAAFKQRMTTCPGVVSTGDREIGTSILFHSEPAEYDDKSAEWKKLQKHMQDLETAWITPNGDEIEHAIHKYKWAYELTSGFYNQLTWPSKKIVARRRGYTEAEAQRDLDKSLKHHARHQEYAVELRRWLNNNHIRGCDTPLLVASHMHQHGADLVGDKLFDAYQAMKDEEFDGLVERDRSVVRVCDYKVKDMVAWVKKHKGRGCLVWVHHNAMGAWAYDALKEAGVDVLWAQAGEHGNRVITDPKNGKRTVVASITAHGIGKNLQYFGNTYFLQWPRPAKTAEQTLGRNHRNGQTLDELIYRLNLTTPFDHMLFAATANDACYVQQTTGQRQKLMIASYDPIPKMYSHLVLKEMGFQPKELDDNQEKFLDDTFGDG